MGAIQNIILFRFSWALDWWCQPNRSLFRLYCYFNDLPLLYNVTLQANSLN